MVGEGGPSTQPNNFNPRLLMIPPAAANFQIGYSRQFAAETKINAKITKKITK
jgi:hypothetical protein